MKTYSNTYRIGEPETQVFWTAPYSDYKIAVKVESLEQFSSGNPTQKFTINNQAKIRYAKPEWYENSLANRNTRDGWISQYSKVANMYTTPYLKNYRTLSVRNVIHEKCTKDLQTLTDDEWNAIVGKSYAPVECMPYAVDIGGVYYWYCCYNTYLTEKFYDNENPNGADEDVRYEVIVKDDNGNVIKTTYDNGYLVFDASSAESTKTYHITARKYRAHKFKGVTYSSVAGQRRAVDILITADVLDFEQTFDLINKVSDSTVWDAKEVKTTVPTVHLVTTDAPKFESLNNGDKVYVKSSFPNVFMNSFWVGCQEYIIGGCDGAFYFEVLDMYKDGNLPKIDVIQSTSRQENELRLETYIGCI